jgi:hypothetical protein
MVRTPGRQALGRDIFGTGLPVTCHIGTARAASLSAILMQLVD